jgi:hypothetical protein
MHVDRLLRLADFLDNLPAGRFDYNHWVGSDWQGDPDLSCGTTACAMGWATTIPEFRALGLKLDHTRPTPYFGEKFGSEAAAEFFDISNEDAIYLFTPNAWHINMRTQSPDQYASPEEVAEHIRQFLKMESRSI